MKVEKQEEDPMIRMDLETNPETFQVIDQIIEQEMTEMFLDRNPTNNLNI